MPTFRELEATRFISNRGVPTREFGTARTRHLHTRRRVLRRPVLASFNRFCESLALRSVATTLAVDKKIGCDHIVAHTGLASKKKQGGLI